MEDNDCYKKWLEEKVKRFQDRCRLMGEFKVPDHIWAIVERKKLLEPERRASCLKIKN